MRRIRELWTQVRVIAGWREHRTDLLAWLWRRPMIAIGIGAAEAAESFSKAVDGRLKLMAQLRVAQLVGCEFCLDVGAALAEHSELSERQLLELADFESSDAFRDDERLVLRYATTLSVPPVQVSSDLRDALVHRRVVRDDHRTAVRTEARWSELRRRALGRIWLASWCAARRPVDVDLCRSTRGLQGRRPTRSARSCTKLTGGSQRRRSVWRPN